ncbi:MerR family transcriptional regulator [Ktedonospora formicarum]|uniref:MerR family transcriptional regulator n=1 Tax=Ktedonospora formicarum TaxID=2778364 RepID=A0A8J3MS96_9CHLR|nr:cobalamin-dependent protein [Ktedonospora formicarum]GHO44636.1 hypothetical protein KSX_27990 [Ktedonospora formicarum]
MDIYEGLNACPNLERYSDDPIYHTRAVEQQTGIRSNTLRVWERRYNFLNPKRAGNDYRLYSERDVILLRWLKERIDQGMSISEAINLFDHLSKAQQQKVFTTPLKESFIFQVASPQPPTPARASKEETREPQEEPPPRREEEHNVSELIQETALSIADEIVQVAKKRLLNAFRELNDAEAQMILTPLLITYPLEQVCVDLITPTLWEIGELWAAQEITVTIEHFASNFFRGLLTNLFHAAPRPGNVPLILVSCAPGEPHEIPALMLALTLRLHNMRVAYLGQSIESEGLLQAIQQLQPGIVCVSLTIAAHMGNLTSLARQIQKLTTSRPHFIFGGQAFLNYPLFVEEIPGTYLHGTMESIVQQIQSFYT